MIEKAEKQAQRSEKEGAMEDPKHDRTLTVVRSPSVERLGGAGGATLPVVEEDAEAASREDSFCNEKAGVGVLNGVPPTGERPPPPTSTDEIRLSNDKRLPSLPKFNRLSMGISTPAPTATEP